MLFLAFLLLSNGEFTALPTADMLQTHIRFLASDELEGRETGFHGQQIAARYLESHFRLCGGSPPFEGSFVQDFPVYVTGLDAQATKLTGNGRNAAELTLYQDFMMSARFTGEGTFEAPLAFVGFGTEKSEIELQDRWALVIENDPDDADHPGVISKVLKARMEGAIGIILVPHPDSDDGFALNGSAAFHQMSLEDQPRTPRIEFPSMRITRSALARLVGKRYPQLEREMAQAKPQPFLVKGARLRLVVAKKHEQRLAQNVGVVLAGNDPNLRDQYVVVSAHYDHLGRVGDHIFNGADDNASGTAALLTLADRMRLVSHKRSLLILAVAGEEEGLLGSQYFLENTPIPIEQMVANLNIDMIGRNQKNQIGIVPTTTDRSTLTDLAEELANRPHHGLELLKDMDRYHHRSDHYNFVKRGIPALFFFSGVHEDYHGKGDDWDRIDYGKLATVYAFIEEVVRHSLDQQERPKFLEAQEKGNRE